MFAGRSVAAGRHQAPNIELLRRRNHDDAVQRSDWSGGYCSTEPPSPPDRADNHHSDILTTNTNNVTIRSVVQGSLLCIVRCGICYGDLFADKLFCNIAIK